MIRPALSAGFEEVLRGFPSERRAGLDTAGELLIRLEGGKVSASLDFGPSGILAFPSPSLPMLLCLLAFACPRTVAIETPEAQAAFEGLFNISNVEASLAFFGKGER